MMRSFAEAGRALARADYVDAAVQNAEFLHRELWRGGTLDFFDGVRWSDTTSPVDDDGIELASGIPTRIVEQEVWIGDKNVRPAGPQDRRRLPVMRVAGEIAEQLPGERAVTRAVQRGLIVLAARDEDDRRLHERRDVGESPAHRDLVAEAGGLDAAAAERGRAEGAHECGLRRWPRSPRCHLSALVACRRCGDRRPPP